MRAHAQEEKPYKIVSSPVVSLITITIPHYVGYSIAVPEEALVSEEAFVEDDSQLHCGESPCRKYLLCHTIPRLKP